MIPRPRPASLATFGLLAVLVAATPAPGQAPPATVIRDEAGMFGEDAAVKARVILDRDRHGDGARVRIETVSSLNGQTIGELAERRHEQDPDATLIILAKKEHRISDLLVPDNLAKRLPESARRAVREAFLADFKKNDYDAGLVHGAEAIEKLLAKGDGGDATSRPITLTGNLTGRTEGAGDLVERNRVRLTLAGARQALAGAEAKAKAIGVKANLAVVDDGGHLLAFARIDGGRPASGVTAITKATSAATYRQATGPVPADAKPEAQLATGLGLQAAAAAGGGKITTLLGGVPIVVDGQVIGALGVGGGTGEQDKEIATAGAEAFQEGLKLTRPPAPAEPKKVGVEINDDKKFDFNPEGRIEKTEPAKDEPKAEAPPKP